jgi:hypothetical protein
LRDDSACQDEGGKEKGIMSIIAYYVHLTAAQMEQLRGDPQKLWQIQADAAFAGAERYDMDQDWQVIPWLLSEKKRAEQKLQKAHSAVWARADLRGQGKEALQRATAEELHKLGVTTSPEAVEKMPDDAALVAMEGRGTKEQRDEAITLGMGGARVFTPAEVQFLAEQLGRLQASDVRLHFDRKEMARWDVGGMGWLQEQDTVLDRALLPAFLKLQDFYRRAASVGHYVLVVYS